MLFTFIYQKVIISPFAKLKKCSVRFSKFASEIGFNCCSIKCYFTCNPKQYSIRSNQERPKNQQIGSSLNFWHSPSHIYPGKHRNTKFCQFGWWSLSFLAIHLLDLEHFKVSGSLVFASSPFSALNCSTVYVVSLKSGIFLLIRLFQVTTL